MPQGAARSPQEHAHPHPPWSPLFSASSHPAAGPASPVTHKSESRAQPPPHHSALNRAEALSSLPTHLRPAGVFDKASGNRRDTAACSNLQPLLDVAFLNLQGPAHAHKVPQWLFPAWPPPASTRQRPAQLSPDPTNTRPRGKR